MTSNLNRLGAPSAPAMTPSLGVPVAISLLVAAGNARSAHADIYRWDNGQLIAGTSGITPGPGVVLNSFVLQFAELSSLNLSSSSFISADLSTAHLISSNLLSAQLRTANLTSASLRSANLTNANLTSATLALADFTDAIITQSNLTGVTALGFTAGQLYSTSSYATGDLRRINFTGNSMSGWNFASKDLSTAVFLNANLTGADFTSANLNLATFTNANLTGAAIRGANLQSTTSRGLTSAMFASTASYAARDLRGVNLTSCVLTNWNLESQNLSGANFLNATLTSTRFAGADLTGANLFVGTMTGTDFTNALISGARINSNFTMAMLASTRSYQDRDLRGVVFVNGTWSNYDFSSQNIAGGSFRGDLINTNFSNANLESVVFQSDVFTGATFTNAVIRGADLTSAVVRGFTIAQFNSTASWQTGDLTGIKLNANVLSGFSFAGKNLTGASFVSATPAGADFTNATITNADFTAGGIPLPLLYSTWNYQNHDLRGIKFVNNNMNTGNLASQDFSGGVLSGLNGRTANFDFARLQSIDITRADLSSSSFLSAAMQGSSLASARFIGGSLQHAQLQGADLTSVDFHSASLRFANLASANLNFADFYGADLRDVNFENANIDGSHQINVNGQGMTFEQLASTVNFRNHAINDVVFSGLSFIGGDFSGQVFTQGQFDVTNLSSSNFANARLSMALHSSTFVSCNFAGARVNQSDTTDFRGANFVGADLAASTHIRSLFGSADMHGVDFSGSSLSDCDFVAADLRGSKFTGVGTTNQFSLADLRRALDFATSNPNSLRGTILPNGSLPGFSLFNGETWRVRNDIPVTVNGSVVAGNGSHVVIDAGARVTSISSITIGTTATLDLGGVLAAQSLTIFSEGVLLGSGEFDGTLSNHGRFTPGHSFGQFLCLGTLASDGIFDMEIGGTFPSQMDHVTVIGDLSVSGSVRVALSSFTPQLGDRFDLLDWTGTANFGLFSFDFTGAALQTGLSWDTSRFTTDGSICVVPTPAAGSLLIFSLAIGIRRRSR